MPADAAEYWKPVLENVQSPAALLLRDQLDLSDVTGLPKQLSKRPPCLDFLTSVKRKHPEKIVCVQVGDFYETAGLDAVLLVEGCGLAPTSPAGGVPRAGFPLGNLAKMRKRILELQLSMVVCEQYGAPDAKGRLQRRIAAIYNPGDESYQEAFADPVPTAPAALMCLSWEQGGFTLAEYRQEQGVVRLTTGMTEDALWGQLVSRNVAAPLCIHEAFMQRVPDWPKRVRRVTPTVSKRIRQLEGDDPIDAFIPFVQMHYGLDPDSSAVSVVREGTGRRCPSFYTAAQLGMTEGTLIPNVLDCLIPKDSLMPVKAWFKDLLLVPRSLETCFVIQKALKQIAEMPDSMPKLRHHLNPNGAIRTLEDPVPCVAFLRKLHALLVDVEMLFETESLRELSKTLLEFVALEHGGNAEAELFLKQCLRMKDAIEDVVVLDEYLSFCAPVDNVTDPQFENSIASTMTQLSLMYEGFWGTVQEKHWAEHRETLNTCKLNLPHIARQTYGKVESTTFQLFRLEFDRTSASLYLKAPAIARRLRESEIPGIRRPEWALGRRALDKVGVYSSAELDEALEDYKVCCAAIADRSNEALSELTNRVDRDSVIIACRFVLAAQSLVQHSWEAQSRDWCVPTITQSSTLKISEMWPYWMPGSDEDTVKNSLILEDMVLLTGPNMAGKSTVLRTVAATATLALAGLYAPAASVECPFLEHIVLRSFSGDSPLHQHSGFSMEMAEMQQAAAASSEGSLILVDELGKGTEVKTGAGISGSLLEFFAARGSIGLFSTHLHLLKKMPLKMNRISMMKMNTNVIEPECEESQETPLKHVYEPDWTVTHGYNGHSLALQVAWKCGLAAEIIGRAGSYETHLVQNPQRPKLPPHINATPELDSVAEAREAEAEEALTETMEAEAVSEDPLAETVESEAVTATVESNNVPFDTGDGCEIKALLREICASKGIFIDASSNAFKIDYVKRGQDPPPRTARRSCVYVYRRVSGHHYVGETDDLRGRLSYHQSKKKRRHLGPFETWYVCIPKTDGAKSMSRSIEKELTATMARAGFLMESTRDAQNKNFGLREER